MNLPSLHDNTVGDEERLLLAKVSQAMEMLRLANFSRRVEFSLEISNYNPQRVNDSLVQLTVKYDRGAPHNDYLKITGNDVINITRKLIDRYNEDLHDVGLSLPAPF